MISHKLLFAEKTGLDGLGLIILKQLNHCLALRGQVTRPNVHGCERQ